MTRPEVQKKISNESKISSNEGFIAFGIKHFKHNNGTFV